MYRSVLKLTKISLFDISTVDTPHYETYAYIDVDTGLLQVYLVLCWLNRILGVLIFHMDIQIFLFLSVT